MHSTLPLSKIFFTEAHLTVPSLLGLNVIPANVCRIEKSMVHLTYTTEATLSTSVVLSPGGPRRLDLPDHNVILLDCLEVIVNR